jgi:lipopolysaccharide export LptBFGC system permease protein LptF
MRKILYLGSLLSLIILLNTNISIAKDYNYNGNKKHFTKSGYKKYPSVKKHLKHDYNHKSDYKLYKYNKNKHQNHHAYNDRYKRHNGRDYYAYNSNHYRQNNHSKHLYYNNYRKHYIPHYKQNYNHHASNHGYAYFNLFPHFLGYFYY